MHKLQENTVLIKFTSDPPENCLFYWEFHAVWALDMYGIQCQMDDMHSSKIYLVTKVI